jgi:hypothetical protein
MGYDHLTVVQCFTYDHLRRLTEAWTTTAVACQSAPSQPKTSPYDVYIEKSAGNLYLMDKSGRNPIPTYFNRGGIWHSGAEGVPGEC